MQVLMLCCDECGTVIKGGEVYYERGGCGQKTPALVEVVCKRCTGLNKKIRDADRVEDGVVHI